MGVTIAQARVAANTSSGTQDLTTTDLGGLTPKAALFLITRASVDGTVTAHGALAAGLTDGTRQSVHGMQAQDAAATTAADKRSSTSHCLQTLVAGTSTVESEAAFSAWITNGVRINWTTAPATAYLITVIFFAGTDLQAYVDTVQASGSIDGVVDITAPAFQPDLVLAITGNNTTAAANGTPAQITIGAAHHNGGTITQRCVAYMNRDNIATVNVNCHMRTDYFSMHMATNAALTAGFEASAFDGSGFSIITRTAGANHYISYLALRFGGVASSWVGTVTTPTATGSNGQTGPGFRPQFVLHCFSMLIATGTATINDNANSFGLGSITSTAQFFNGLWDDDSAADSVSKCISDNQPVNLQNGVDGTGLAATFTSFGATGWTVSYSDVETNAKQGWALAIQESAAATKAPPPRLQPTYLWKR